MLPEQILIGHLKHSSVVSEKPAEMNEALKVLFTVNRT